MKKVIDSHRNTTICTRDGFSQLWEVNSPDTGITTYNYASDGQLQGFSRADGTLITYTYDGNGRLTGIQVPGIQSLSFAYDDANRIGKITNGIA